ncbi:putative dna mismatch repair protein [Erysiphe necator]|uniref:Putative dna mismatch repair protein n=1 Tax=Uncinula necator TaxID=52586 RepID=A0A0B1P831_UNCNE|nr:putative dna mismatch repair protein [Erysiphe necator]
MTIAPLPTVTICLLGSTQALTTPTSLVKELIDNALDAKATAVEIIISPNTIDRIEVRDNGNGIPREDFNALGRRGHTSKLKTFEELKFIGGVSLGFRGEALFSAVQLGKVFVTSKSEGETVATTAKLNPQGGAESLTSISHPVGTTIVVTEFLWSVPVRKQTCLKEASKTIGKIKELLRAYSLARPHVRFSLKDNRGGKVSWLYSPRRNDGIKETVSQVISRDLASQCLEKSVIFSENILFDEGNESEIVTTFSRDKSLDKKKYTVDVFLPKPTADCPKLSHGQYISVDGRPVSNEKGTIKRIITIFKHYIKSCFTEKNMRISNPFLHMKIKCPMESYDPNIEPAKDDIIFINEKILLENIEGVFKEVYGERQLIANIVGVSEKATQKNFDILLSRQVPASTPNELPLPMTEISPCYSIDHGVKLLGDLSPIRLKDGSSEIKSVSQTEKLELCRDHEEIAGTPAKSITPSKNLVSTPESANFSLSGNTLNPWIISKINQSLKKPEYKRSPPKGRSICQNLLPSPQLSSDPTMIEFEINEVQEMPVGSNEIPNTINSNSALAPTIENASGNLISPCSSLAEKDRNPKNVDTELGLFVSPDDSSSPRRCDFISARQILDPQQYPELESSKPKRLKTIKKPFISPIKKKKKIQQEDLQQTLLTDVSLISRSGTNENDQKSKEANSDLDWFMDYEHRKQEATKNFREELRMSQKSNGSPYNNRYNAATLALDANSCPDHLKAKKSISYPKIDTSLSDNDPRGYYIRRQKSFLSLVGMADGPKISRAKSLRLPLERIPVEQQLHQLLMRIRTSIEEVNKMSDSLKSIDLYVKRGNQKIPLKYGLANSDSKDKEYLIYTVRDLIEKKLKNDHNSSDLTTDNIEFKFNQYVATNPF